MRSALIVLCVLLQLGVLGYMVYGRESVVASGQRIYMATAPIDPRDPFRGDFVRLQYAANNLDSAPQQWSQPEEKLPKGAVVYALLEEKPSGLHEVVKYTDVQPETGLFIRGRKSTGRAFGRGRSQPGVRFGIEQLFVQQGDGIAIEDKRGIRGGLQTAMEVEIAIGATGTAVLTGYRWSDLGVQIELTEHFPLRQTNANQATSEQNTEEPDQSSSQSASHIVVSIQNVSDSPVVLNNPGDNCGFRLEPANRDSKYSEAVNSCTDLDSVTPLILEVGQIYEFEINLTYPRWFMNYASDGETSTGDLREFDSNEMIRVVYRGGRTQSNTIDGNQQLWRGDLLSQGFNSRGRVD